MGDFDWVTALGECSPYATFSQLKDGVLKDIDARNELVPPTSGLKFSLRKDIDPAKDKFTVLKIAPDGSDSDSVLFSYSGRTFSVVDRSFKPSVQGTLTLNDVGECRIRVGEQELE